MAAWLAGTGAAGAQVAVNVTLASNQTFRGETISNDDPALTVAVGLDDASGLFAGADVSLAAGAGEPRVTTSNQYAGFAARAGRVSLEVGAIHREYGPVFDDAYRRRYSEIYAGVAVGRVQVRAYVSPDYLVDGRNTYYVEANARLGGIAGWKVDGHAGLSLIPHDIGDPRTSLISYEDWSLRASRPVGKFSLSLGLAASNYPVFGPTGKIRFSAQVSRAF